MLAKNQSHPELTLTIYYRVLVFFVGLLAMVYWYLRRILFGDDDYNKHDTVHHLPSVDIGIH